MTASVSSTTSNISSGESGPATGSCFAGQRADSKQILPASTGISLFPPPCPPFWFSPPTDRADCHGRRACLLLPLQSSDHFCDCLVPRVREQTQNLAHMREKLAWVQSASSARPSSSGLPNSARLPLPGSRFVRARTRPRSAVPAVRRGMHGEIQGQPPGHCLEFFCRQASFSVNFLARIFGGSGLVSVLHASRQNAGRCPGAGRHFMAAQLSPACLSRNAW
jgi:hypothetical protein